MSAVAASQPRLEVGLGQLVTTMDGSHVVAAVGLGSCIGVVMHDEATGIGGMAHVMLPESRISSGPAPAGKFADTAVPALIAELLALGAAREGLKIKMAGGAQMFSAGSGGPSALNVGSRNGIAVRAAIQEAGLLLLAADTGGSSGRTVELVVATGEILVRTVGGQSKPL